ncbi:uncharacterized protein LOC131005735 [Salvia miltiorrhiza]|uniref:uncharacterized protein LOC131005735 n=1 Tax=Salvia miltiorrhiza TaxID=226208 RepID=UPI0025AD6AD6|nr:uncharacterized protein LOC131005735 [Salvia miltiorrhiza]
MVQEIDCCFVQETKLEKLSEIELRGLWGSEKFGFASRKAEGRSGGILTIWNSDIFSCSSTWDVPGALFVNDNIVIPAFVWLGILTIRHESERVGRGTQFEPRDVSAFDNFIKTNDLVDVRLQGRLFTWYQPNGLCKSKLDRFLVNGKWLEKWSHSKVIGLQRTVSDHCPLILETKSIDWGPKPFRFLNAWISHCDFEKVVKESWERPGISGWKNFVFKEKLKRLKEDLKKWNQSSFGSIEANIKKLKQDIQKWDAIDDTLGLEEGELISRNEATANLIIQMKNRDSLLAQNQDPVG